MEEKMIFIFDAEEGNILSQDVCLDDGTILVPKETVLNLDIIASISAHHILEIKVYKDEAITESKASGGNSNGNNTNTSNNVSNNDNNSYFDKVRSTEAFKQFNKNYIDSIANIKNDLNDFVLNNAPMDINKLIQIPSTLLAQSSNSLQLFDMLHSMRNFDDMTFVHCINVSLICSVIGQWLHFSKEDIEILTLSGLLHDIGKLMIPVEILSKPDRLTINEYAIMKNHVNLGYGKLKNANIDTRIKEACLLHHERCDGSGYPFGLSGDKIPAVAKIAAIADVYDAMTSARVYRDSICPFTVVGSIYEDAFTKFDPKYAIPFLKNVASSYINNDVRLSDGRIGKVILINDNALSKPVVLCNGEYIDLSKNTELNIVSIIGSEG